MRPMHLGIIRSLLLIAHPQEGDTAIEHSPYFENMHGHTYQNKLEFSFYRFTDGDWLCMETGMTEEEAKAYREDYLYTGHNVETNEPHGDGAYGLAETLDGKAVYRYNAASDFLHIVAFCAEEAESIAREVFQRMGRVPVSMHTIGESYADEDGKNIIFEVCAENVDARWVKACRTAIKLAEGEKIYEKSNGTREGWEWRQSYPMMEG